jgi:hypothetical protein
MPCLVALIALFLPRVVIACLALFTNYMSTAYQTLLWPLLGFFFMPYTTLAYAWAKNSHGSVDGGYLVVVIVAVLIDLGVVGGGARARKTRVVRVVEQPR